MNEVGRNSPCPCGSGKKAKKCHPDSVGLKVSTSAWYLETLGFIESCQGYVAPMDDSERAAWKRSGCPHSTCDWETDQGVSCAALNCGV